MNDVTLSHVLYVPGLNVNLISTTATPWRYEWTITPNAMTLRNRARPEMVYCTAKQKEGLHDAVFPEPNLPLANAHVTKVDQLEIMALHQRLGHAGKNTMGQVIVIGLGGSIRASDLSDLK